jgi:hypothetical protein
MDKGNWTQEELQQLLQEFEVSKPDPRVFAKEKQVGLSALYKLHASRNSLLLSHPSPSLQTQLNLYRCDHPQSTTQQAHANSTEALELRKIDIERQESPGIPIATLEFGFTSCNS